MAWRGEGKGSRVSFSFFLSATVTVACIVSAWDSVSRLSREQQYLQHSVLYNAKEKLTYESPVSSKTDDVVNREYPCKPALARDNTAQLSAQNPFTNSALLTSASQIMVILKYRQIICLF